jgi:DNA repair ATPase RecN
MQKEQAASITAAEIMAIRQATAHKWGEEEAAALQHLKSEHGAFRIKVGHYCGHSEAPQVRGTRGGVSGMFLGVSLGDHDCGRG